MFQKIFKRKINWSLIKLLIQFLLIISLYGCTSNENETKSLYPIIDSGMPATGDSLRSDIAWLDDEHILFVAGKPVTSDEDPALTIWEIGKGFERYKSNVSGICFSQGRIWYAAYTSRLHTKKNVTIFQGPFRQEIPVDQSGAHYFDRLNCRYLDERPVDKEGHDLMSLLDEHGYLDLAPTENNINSTSSVLFYKKGMTDPIKMPFTINDINSSRIQYYPFKQAYLIFGRHKNQNALIKQKSLEGAKPQLLWWLYPNGKVEQVSIPPGPWLLGGSTFLRATKEGFFIAYLGGYKSITRSSGQGAYFIQDDEIIKVIDGPVIAPTVSPDGCRVAYSHVPSWEQVISKKSQWTLNIINFCNK